ncbi:hypothetical protein J5N97_025705 [Dioscorea zingiberensis]|uniref:Glucose-methanol-choline oxidoreductase N-terminal domain-containing protein n=1 Tax=Dioscorea zingiberensis TaxID=325984 RepID=A0A9D5C0T0_9LILI|nr:hypothetical protein J5N97_025705 [Dioscorea zingiberensis]
MAWKKEELFLIMLLFATASWPSNGDGFSKLNKYPYLREASSFSTMPKQEYDYIVVGGGTAGCALGATLSQKFSVLVLERGGSPYGNPNISYLENFHIGLANSSPNSPVQRFLSTDGVPNHRARVLGGATCINAGFYTRASPRYVNYAGWDEELVEESYEWVEKQIVHKPEVAPWQAAVKDALLEVGVTPFNGLTYEHIIGTKISGSTFDNNGFRHTAADLLAAGNHLNLHVLLHATVQKIVFDTTDTKPKAVGVIFEDENNDVHEAFIKPNGQSEVILSAGAIGTPQLLLLSGVGAEEELKKLNIPVVVKNENVGKEMKDNPMSSILIPTMEPQNKSLIQVVGITNKGFYIETTSGFGPTDASIVKTNQSLREAFRGGSIGEKIIGPLSTGNLSLTSTDINANPAVTFNYFSDPEDLRRCVAGVRLILDLAKTRAVAELTGNRSYTDEMLLKMSLEASVNLIPKKGNESESLEQFCKSSVVTIWHYHGGCLVGKVVDGDYKVMGVESLRVIDSSLFSFSPGTNPQATVMMLGRYMGVKITRERFSVASQVVHSGKSSA